MKPRGPLISNITSILRARARATSRTLSVQHENVVYKRKITIEVIRRKIIVQLHILLPIPFPPSSRPFLSYRRQVNSVPELEHSTPDANKSALPRGELQSMPGVNNVFSYT